MVEMTNEQYAKVSYGFVTATGKPASVHGTPSALNDNDSGALVQNAQWDGTTGSFELWSVSGAGPLTGLVTVTADADLGDGIKEIKPTLAWSVILPEAVGATFTVGEVLAKP